MQIKNSKQRSAILAFMLETRTHPSAEEVFLHVKTQFPNISLGTVYRNLNLLVEQKLIKKIAVGQHFVRFDGNEEVHHHFVCESCGTIQDLVINRNEVNIEKLTNKIDGVVHYEDLTFYGLCKKCMN